MKQSSIDEEAACKENYGIKNPAIYIICQQNEIKLKTNLTAPPREALGFDSDG